MDIKDKYISRDELSQMLGVHERTLARWCDKPDFPKAYKLSSKIHLFLKEEIEAWIEGKRD